MDNAIEPREPLDVRGVNWTYEIKEAPFSILQHLDDVKYQVEGDCAINGNAETHGFISFKKQRRINYLKSLHPTAKFKTAVGTAFVNYELCHGVGSYINKNANGQPNVIREVGIRPNAPKNAHKKKPEVLIAGPDGKERSVWAHVLLPDVSYHEADALLVEHQPEKMLTKGPSIRRELKLRKKPPHKTLFSIEDFNRKPLEFIDDKVILLWGPSDTGKSSFGRARA